MYHISTKWIVDMQSAEFSCSVSHDQLSALGLVNFTHMAVAQASYGPARGFRRPRYEEQAWMDKIWASNDCKHQMFGLDFVVVMDMDESMVPKIGLDTYHDILSIGRYTLCTARPNYDGVDRNSRWAFILERTYFVLNNLVLPRKPYTREKSRVDKEHRIIYRHLNAFTNKKQMLNNRFIPLADDRVELRTMIDDACTRPWHLKKKNIHHTADDTEMKKRAPKRDLEKNGESDLKNACPLRRQPEKQQTCLNEEPLPSPLALDRSERTESDEYH
ncbi:hypothetical protein PoB_002570400 [Plakobranchus ocellatus]|uniref:Glycosyltransferase family 92 protein n=1 Tax=Plakobranchus ocellatus TaxID=259542 RepID=A0AAV3ZXS6_9GAST|nr:hypothetical protein PoB_002570400 [Plakobranchus ocellatus]